jgi:hypothetical protein
MQHVDGAFKPDGVNRTKGIAIVAFDNFKHALPFALSRFGVWVLCAELRHTKRIPHVVLRLIGEVHEVAFG